MGSFKTIHLRQRKQAQSAAGGVVQELPERGGVPVRERLPLCPRGGGPQEGGPALWTRHPRIQGAHVQALHG